MLNNVNMSQINDSGEMLILLSKIMEKFDMKELEESKGLFDKIFNTAKKQLEKILAKYHTMGEEIDKIYVQLKKYESEIKDSNKNLESMFQTNVNYYNQLVKYILAGEQGIREIEAYIAQRRQDFENTGDNSIQFELTTLEQAKLMLEQPPTGEIPVTQYHAPCKSCKASTRQTHPSKANPDNAQNDNLRDQP